MDEYVLKQKIQEAFHAPRAPEEVIQKVILRTKAVSMGVNAQKQLETAPADKIGELASQVLIGQFAAVSELPEGTQPEQLAHQLEQKSAFREALHGGNVARRLSSGELMQQMVRQEPAASQEPPEISAPKNEGPVMG